MYERSRDKSNSLQTTGKCSWLCATLGGKRGWQSNRQIAKIVARSSIHEVILDFVKCVRTAVSKKSNAKVNDLIFLEINPKGAKHLSNIDHSSITTGITGGLPITFHCH